MKVVYIAHPIHANTRKEIRENINRLKKIIRYINMTEKDVIPYAHYLVELSCLNDRDEKERERGIMNNRILFHKGFIDELWLYGNKISKGMFDEILLAYSLGIPVKTKTEYVEREYGLLLRKWQKGEGLHH